MEALKREQIKDRMIRLAAEHWNINENEIEANFDPLIILLFDAVASEIESVGYEIRDIQNNLLNELASLLLPHSVLQAKPASCILSTVPNEKECVIKKENSFSVIAQIQKLGEPVNEVELNFTPIGDVKLYRTSLLYLRIGNKVHKLMGGGKKTLLHEGAGEEMISEIHFVLDNKDAFNSLDGLQLFFDLRGHSEAKSFYYALQSALLTINGKEVEFSNGYYNNFQYQPNLKDAFSKDGSYLRKVQKEIAGIYAGQFFTLKAGNINSDATPGSFLDGLPEKLTQEINQAGMLFCTLKLKRPFSREVFERLQIGINAFPVINRKLQTINYKTDRWINIIPLQVSGNFLDIRSIENSSGIKYRLHSSTYSGKVNEGEAILRNARVAKNSSNDVRNTIKSLLEAIRDESAYFSRTSNDFIAARLVEISKILTRLEDQMQSSKDIKTDFRYVLLKAKTVNETVQVQYWITSPEEASSVKAAVTFKPVQHTFTVINSTFSLTGVVGGQDVLSDYSQKQALKRQLSSRGKIISIEDIKLACYELFGPKLQRVEVQKKMKVMPDGHSGISRFIEIKITVGKNDFSEDELVYLDKQLRYQLDTNASFMFPIDIMIESI
ncbi:MAG TPA: hypothetical protein PK110_04555 [Niabella sp.]|jgi:hypothetical protein|nr:hypothetical protein [Chitinophagaceae bacterium]HRO84074.1 hypothetical protein [Niabella sp.]